MSFVQWIFLLGTLAAAGPGLVSMSFGEELRRERELRQITLREVSESTKISLRYLEALERNEFEGLPGGVFNRGFVRAYAEFIGVDPEGMVNAYLLEEQSQSGRIPTERRLLRRGARESQEANQGGAARRLPGWLRWGVMRPSSSSVPMPFTMLSIF